MNKDVNTRPLAGVFWMLVTGVFFVTVTALVKTLGPRIPSAEAAFLRYALGLVFLLPMIRPMLRARLTRRQLGLFGLRGVAHTIGVTMWFYAMTQIPIAEVTAMNYLSPIFVTIAAALFLGETLALRRVLAIVAALMGALIILRPGFRELSSGHLAMLGTAVVFSVGYLTAKILSEEVSASVVVGMLSVTVTIGLAPLAAAVWVTPTLTELMILMGVATFATAGHYTMTLAFAAAPITLTQPVTFLQLVWAVLMGWLIFDEGVDIWVLLGGGLIIAAISFITWREAMLKRRAVTPTVNATKV
ncbi:MAG: DMT family transporter [Rhodobacteraceae bacterium]|nr:DMT family transporter [Paracoccaceae bacterium]MCW9043509.1 DMT family transporter [Pseudopelagicola sp.]